MALEKALLTPEQFNLTYHRIYGFTVDKDRKVLGVLVSSHKDRDASLITSPSGERCKGALYSFPFTEGDGYVEEPTFDQLYSLLKQVPMFENSVDI